MNPPAKSKPAIPPAWWHFINDEGDFVAESPEALSRLYFPLCNEAGLLSSITPDLNGDIKTGQNSFLTLPLSTEDLHNTRSRRNFWVLAEGREPWSVAGSRGEKGRLEAGILWHRVTRENKRVGLRAEILNFVPVTSDTVEIMQVTLTNVSRKPLRLTPTAAIPIFARSADNLRDHRQVTSLLHRILPHLYGVLVRPTMSFDERGHRPNTLVYAVLGAEEDGERPIGCFPTTASFIGEGGNFDRPRAVFEDEDPPELSGTQLQGREAVGALRFKNRKLAPGKSAVYILLLGVARDRQDAEGWLRSFGTEEKTKQALTATRRFWQEKLNGLQLRADDLDYSRWLRWIALQPMLRRIFGNSFLPDFDYGRGGRGWRDLWQDALALLLLQPEAARDLLLNNFAGVRMNGTNATIIGKAPGEFIADRNNLSRVWMDHGVWPWLTTELYIHQTGDLSVLLEEAPYFWDRDQALSPAADRGSILEHLLVQHLTAYFNVGDHGNCRLEDADWNDGLDMAREGGESVPFTAVFAGNLLRLSEALKRLGTQSGVRELALAEELGMLLESQAPSTELTPKAKRERLSSYRTRTHEGVSGRKRRVRLESLAEDLAQKGTALADQVRRREWLTHKSGHSWFNGYYDNNGERVEGDFSQGVRMTLTGQVFPILAGVATEEQIERCFLAAKRYLQDKKRGGFRLNTDFGDSPPPLGRAFYFAYGEKENGAFFSHMSVMFACALYSRGFVREGHEVLSGLYRMAMNAETARIYPGLPEYFNGEGRGMYPYLTGSASWYLLTLVTQVLGIRGQWGDLLLAPKLMPEQFGRSGQIIAHLGFAGKRLKVTYFNRGKKTYGKYHIESVLIHGRSHPLPEAPTAEIVIPRSALSEISTPMIDITVALA